ncbi:MAG: VOC family protein [Pseudomonadota bacterium]
MNVPDSGPRAEDLAYLRFQAPDLDLMEAFLDDFGLLVTRAKTPGGNPVLYSRGTDTDPVIHIVEQGESRFVGVGFLLPSEHDLRALANMDGASAIENMETPGGGRRVRFTDPQGIEVDGFFGWEPVPKIVPDQRVPVNSGENRVRKGSPVRLHSGPAHAKRLGHVVLFVHDFRTSEAWYKERFGFVTSDDIWLNDETNVVGAFMRCDRGSIPTDHHTVFLLTAPEWATPGNLQHAAFEVNDWDDVMLGHDYLAEREYTPQWGVGKHILGSQVFDYWRDPYGHVLEHFSDGDLFDASHPPGLHPVDVLRTVQWGDKFPNA